MIWMWTFFFFSCPLYVCLYFLTSSWIFIVLLPRESNHSNLNMNKKLKKKVKNILIISKMIHKYSSLKKKTLDLKIILILFLTQECPKLDSLNLMLTRVWAKSLFASWEIIIYHVAISYHKKIHHHLTFIFT